MRVEVFMVQAYGSTGAFLALGALCAFIAGLIVTFTVRQIDRF